MEDTPKEPSTLQFEVDEEDLEETTPPDALDLLRTVEMDKVTHLTRPMPALDAQTRPYRVPSEVLALARATTEMDSAEFAEFRAVIDPDGAVTVPESLRERCRGAVRIRIYFDED
jgi:hypothetical protein